MQEVYSVLGVVDGMVDVTAIQNFISRTRITTIWWDIFYFFDWLIFVGVSNGVGFFVKDKSMKCNWTSGIA